MKSDIEMRNFLKEQYGMTNVRVPRNKVLNPLTCNSKGVIDYGEENVTMIEIKFNLQTHVMEDELYFLETLPLYVTKEESDRLIELSNFVKMLSTKDLSILIDNSDLYDRVITDLKEGSISIYKFYMDILFTREEDEVYSMYATEFFKELVDTKRIDAEKKIVMVQCLGNEPGRVVPTTHLIEPSRGLIFSLKMTDDGKLDPDNDFQVSSLDYYTALCYVIRSVFILLSCKVEGIEHFSILAPIKELAEAIKATE